MAINGDLILVDAYITTAYKPVVCLTSNDLTTNAEILETQNKCQPGVISKEYGSINNSISGEAEYVDDSVGGSNAGDAGFNWLREQQAAKTKFTVRVSTALAETGKDFLYGTAIVSDLSQTAPAGDKTTWTVTFDIDGALTNTDPHP